MSKEELDRFEIMTWVVEGKMKQKKAAKLLGLSARQVRRIKKRFKKEGAQGLVHLLRGQPSNNRISETILLKATKLIEKKYSDFKPLLATEHLDKDDGIKISVGTIRKLMIKIGLWKNRKRKEKHRIWRERKECIGEMIQLDGSTHDWFEGRAPKCALIAFIDDATSDIMHAEFADSETTMNLFRATREYIMENGIPRAFYVDKDGIYKVNISKSEKKYDEETMTQYSQAMEDLGVKMIFANSPQAKGRVERLFGTLQDRLIKEMRLAGINGPEQGNKFLKEIFIPFFNKRYGVPAINPVDLHEKFFRKHDLDIILSKKTRRVINRDFTVQHENKFYQIEEKQPVRVYSRQKVFIEERMDGRMRMLYGKKYINFHKIAKQPYKPRFAFYPRNQKRFWEDAVFAQHSNAVRV